MVPVFVLVRLPRVTESSSRCHRRRETKEGEAGLSSGSPLLSSPPSLLFFFHQSVSSALFTAAPLKRSAETRFR